MSAPERIGGKTLAEWRHFARRDDCLDHMVPSDLRQIIGLAFRAHPAPSADVQALVDALHHADAAMASLGLPDDCSPRLEVIRALCPNPKGGA